MQGVGFRPYVYRLARELGLAGHVFNDERGVEAEVEGPAQAVEEFMARLPAEAPPLAVVESVDFSALEPTGEEGFEIVHSATRGEPLALVSPDVATCDACLAELFDPADRRHRYPFLNCTDCGPALHHRARRALRPAAHHHGRLRDVRGLPGGVRRSARPPLSRAAECVPGLRALPCRPPWRRWRRR